MSDDWKNNPRLSGMDPQKLSMLQGLAIRVGEKSVRTSAFYHGRSF